MSRRFRRLHAPDHENLDRWLVSYADFITLLFAFFVVMYALSSLNEGKYRVLSESLVSAFRVVGADGNGQAVFAPQSIPAIRPVIVPSLQDQARKRQTDRMKSVAREILDVMAPLVKSGQVTVIETDRGVTIEINDSLLFAPGQAVLDPAAVRAMQAVAEVIAPTEFPVIIEGHTDNVPISTPQFPSNWELSAVRATTVLRLFVDTGVGASRLTAIGYGDQRPVSDNATPEGRARNRRVAIQIEASLGASPSNGGAKSAEVAPGSMIPSPAQAESINR